MKHAATIVVLTLFLIPQATALQRPGTVSITSKSLYARTVSNGVLTVYSLYNRSLTPNSIGNAAIICASLGGGGPIPIGSRYCQGTYTIGTGSSIEVSGLVRRPLYTELAVIGGTGIYHNVGGSVRIIRYANHPIRERLVFRLTIS